MVDKKKFCLVQPIECWKMPFWEKIFQGMTLYNTQITTDKQSTDFFLGMIALKTDSDLIKKFKWIGKMTYSVIK